MQEPKVKQLTIEWLRANGYNIRPEPPAPIDEENRELVLDFYAYRETEPEVLWIEAKGDVGVSQFLEGFVRTELCVHYGGGLGLLALSTEGCNRLLKYSGFLEHSVEKIAVLDVEKKVVYDLKNNLVGKWKSS